MTVMHEPTRVRGCRGPSTGFPRQRTKGQGLLAYLAEHEDLHDVRRSVQERDEDLQYPQQDVIVCPLPVSASVPVRSPLAFTRGQQLDGIGSTDPILLQQPSG